MREWEDLCRYLDKMFVNQLHRESLVFYGSHSRDPSLASLEEMEKEDAVALNRALEMYCENRTIIYDYVTRNPNKDPFKYIQMLETHIKVEVEAVLDKHFIQET
jgi:hypothetical protein